MNLWHNYISPTTLSEALRALRDSPGPAAPIAGGTDLLLDMGQGRHSPATTLVDLTSVAEMTALDSRAGMLFIGGAVPLTRIARDPLTAQHAEALVEACDLIGGPQVRNVATLGGNVAHALPAADGTIALLALDAVVEIAALDGSRRLPIAELFEGPGKSVLKRGTELIVGFHIPLKGRHEASAFKRIMRPQGVALPIINLAVWIRRSRDTIEAVRLAVGPSGPTPRRALEAEQALVGGTFSDKACRLATEALLAHATFRTSPRRAGADYRRQLVGPLLQEALSCAWSRTEQ
ncbi:MAG: FAD binding domain-containing protein [Chloroflexota bacterium]